MKTLFMRKVLLLTICFALFTSSQLFATPLKKGREYFEQRGEVMWEVSTDHKVIALTFDDGPDPKETTQILDLLKQYDAKATFFVVGERVEHFPEIIKREITEGHELGNHTFKHTFFSKSTAIGRIQQELEKTQDAIFKVVGKKTYLFRPPGGYYSENVVNASKQAGYIMVMWSWHQDTMDWNTPGVGKIVNKVLNNARNGDIVLFHDHVEGQTQTVEALKQILPELKDRGFQFVTVSQLLSLSKSNPAKSVRKMKNNE